MWLPPAHRATAVELPEQQAERDRVRAPDRDALEQELATAFLLRTEQRRDQSESRLRRGLDAIVCDPVGDRAGSVWDAASQN